MSPCENTKLKHEKGVAVNIANYAGSEIFDISNELVEDNKGELEQKKAYVSEAGKLKC